VRLTVIGTGYLGAVHAAAMAKLGHEVVGIDVDTAKVAKLNAGEEPFHEPGFPEVLREQLATGRLRFSTDFADAADADVHFVAVGTPQRKTDGRADLTYVDAAFMALTPYLKPGALVVGKSTVPVGTAARLAEVVAARWPLVATHAGGGEAPRVAWNPEFLREGFAVKDTLEPDRLVYGVADLEPADASSPSSRSASEILDEVYAQILQRDTPRIVTDLATAELVKVSANAFLATKISFINAMAEIAEATGADVTTLADAIGFDSRIGRKFLNAGAGFGGGCLPKDIRAFTARAEELGRGDSVAFLKEVDAINLRRRERVVQLALESCGGTVYQHHVAVLGLAFKPDSDDVRDSPALDVAVRLNGLGGHVCATDPQAIETARRLHPQLDYAPTLAAAVAEAEVVILVTEWAEYKALTPESLAALTPARTIIDARNVLDAAAWRGAGWTYRGLGRP